MLKPLPRDQVDAAIKEVAALRHPDPHAVLGIHPDGDGVAIRAFRPDAVGVTALPESGGRIPLEHQMGGVFENMIAFWRGRNISDAVKWAEAGKVSALELATAASAGDAERADAAFKTLTDTCRSCHEAHREKVGEGKYRLK